MYKMIDTIFTTGQRILDDLRTTQAENLHQAAELIATAHKNGHKFFVSGSGHSHTVAEELYGRAGTLAFTVPILTPELTLVDHPTKSTMLERLDGYAKILVDLYRVSEGDVILIASNSGRNAYPVEMAIEARNRGAKVICITNLKHSQGTTSRHVSGKKLYEVSDVVIDNCGDIGDATTPVEGTDAIICPTSSISNALICACINGEVCQCLHDMGEEVEVFVSANLDGGFERNEKYFEKYTGLY